jgi:hypothetical protein
MPGSDRAVPFAQFTIPGTGPGGRHGFTGPAVINVRNGQYGHSTAFTEVELHRNLARGGSWDRFLREPLATFSDPTRFVPKAWSPARAYTMARTRICRRATQWSEAVGGPSSSAPLRSASVQHCI